MNLGEAMISASARRPCRVLIAEGDRRAAATLARLLREDGYLVETVHDGATALARLVREPVPDVLLLDECLPTADGLAVATLAAAQHPTPHLVLVTIHPEIASPCRRSLPPSSAVFAKPLAYADLSHALGHWRAQRAST